MLEVRARCCASSHTRRTTSAYLRRETLARLAEAVGYERDIAHEAFALWHAARNQLRTVCRSARRRSKQLRPRYRLATLSNGNADLAIDRHRAPF